MVSRNSWKYLSKIRFRAFMILCLIAAFSTLSLSACTTSDTEERTVLDDELTGELDSLEGEDISTAQVSDEAASSDDAEFDEFDEEGNEDDEFLAEDSEAPAADAQATDLAESDLQDELNKKPEAGVDKNAPVYPEESTAAAAASADPPTTANSSTITSKESTRTGEGFEYLNTSDPTLPKEDLGVSDPLVSEVDPPIPSLKAAREMVPVSKIGRDPFYRNERLMNTVYVTRPGDDLGTISEKLFGEDKTAILLTDNPHISKGIEPGDKIYYNSPNRSEDRKEILTYYEDNKMPASYYETRSGDNIQKIGRDVLGYEDGWKEIWAVNETLQTQAMLPQGLRLRYWTGNETKKSSPTTAMTAPSAPPPSSGSVSTADADMPEDKEALQEMPVEIPINEALQASGNDPSLSGTDNVPVLPETSLPTPRADEAAVKPQNTSSLVTIAGIAIVVLAVIALIAIQIKNRKSSDSEIPPSLEFTKV